MFNIITHKSNPQVFITITKQVNQDKKTETFLDKNGNIYLKKILFAIN